MNLCKVSFFPSNFIKYISVFVKRKTKMDFRYIYTPQFAIVRIEYNLQTISNL